MNMRHWADRKMLSGEQSTPENHPGNLSLRKKKIFNSHDWAPTSNIALFYFITIFLELMISTFTLTFLTLIQDS